jgi:hypothetical protein
MFTNLPMSLRLPVTTALLASSDTMNAAVNDTHAPDLNRAVKCKLSYVHTDSEKQ